MNNMSFDFGRDTSLSKAFSMLKAMAAIGVPRPLMGVLIDLNLEAHQLSKLTAEDRLFLTGPIICHSASGWGPEEWDGHPVYQFKDQIAAERTEIALGTSPFLVGPTEIMCVLYAATMAAPLLPTISEIYLWAAAKAVARRSPEQRLTLKQVYAMLDSGVPGSHRNLTDRQVLNDAPWRQEYIDLCGEIRRKVIAEATNRKIAARRSK